jgi:hypothetical protein
MTTQAIVCPPEAPQSEWIDCYACFSGLFDERIGIPDKGRSAGRIPPPTERGSQDAGLANPASRAYALAKTIVHGLLVLMVWPVGASVPVAWLTVNCTIVSVFFSSGGPKASSALAA